MLHGTCPLIRMTEWGNNIVLEQKRDKDARRVKVELRVRVDELPSACKEILQYPVASKKR